MNQQDIVVLTDYWNRETSHLNGRIDDCFREAQNHAYDLGWQRGIQQADAELVDILSQIMADLPSRRDWLDPVLEQRARAAIAKATAKGK